MVDRVDCSNKNEEMCNKIQKHKNKRTNSEIISPHCVKIRLRFSRQFIAIRCLSKTWLRPPLSTIVDNNIPDINDVE